MKFVIVLEDSGYAIRFWNQIKGEIGDAITSNWDKHSLHEDLASKGFNISKKELMKALHILDSNSKPFVVLRSHPIGNIDLDNFLNEQFTIDNELN